MFRCNFGEYEAKTDRLELKNLIFFIELSSQDHFTANGFVPQIGLFYTINLTNLKEMPDINETLQSSVQCVFIGCNMLKYFDLISQMKDVGA